MSKFWSPFVSDLVPYVPGEQPKLTRLVKLNTNENPYGPSPKAIDAMRAALTDDLRLYPDPNSDLLKHAVADYYKVQPSQVFWATARMKCWRTFSMLCFSTMLRCCSRISPTASIQCIAACMASTMKRSRWTNSSRFVPKTTPDRMPGSSSPTNAPTGCLLGLDKVEQIIKASPDSVVVVDEAYIDFGGETAITLVDRYPNLLVTQTLSKSRSLAGLRVGTAVGHPDLIEALERVKNSFNSYPLDRMANVGGAAAFEDREHFETTRNKVIESREALVEQLQGKGFEVLPSAANFIFARHPQHDAAALAARLREQGVIVRHFKQQRIAQFLRISIGTPEQHRGVAGRSERPLRSGSVSPKTG